MNQLYEPSTTRRCCRRLADSPSPLTWTLALAFAPSARATESSAGPKRNIIANPGVEKADFELWSMAVSTINGCENCTAAHDDVIRKEGVTKEQAWEAVKIAGTVAGVAQAVEIDANI